MSVDFYQILESIIQSNLAANAINTELAVGIAEHIITELAERFGGQAIYLKNNSKLRLAEKHRQILADFNGSNYVEIYRKYWIGEAWLKKLLKRPAENKSIK